MLDKIKLYDVIGIGFGPANLAVAIAMQESSVNEQSMSYCFLEKKPEFEWHGGMLLDGTRMQISFLKDLVTQRNPSSHYTFVNYLHQHNRLNSFINLSSFSPSRIEFNDYLSWAASHFSEYVDYGANVVAVEPVEVDGEVDIVKVVSLNAQGGEDIRYTRNLIVGVGGTPKVPDQFLNHRSDKVIHSSGYKTWRKTLKTENNKPKVAIVGAGQSAAEIFVELCNDYPDGEISLVNRSRAIYPADDSPFVNEIFNPEFTDEIYSYTPEKRNSMIQRFSGTNYSVVDKPEIEAIYERLYLQEVTGKGVHKYLPLHEISEVAIAQDNVAMRLRNRSTQTKVWHDYDAVVLATGYHYNSFNTLLDELKPWVHMDNVERCYRLPLKDGCKVNIFLQGCCESTHGLSDTLLSILAVRSQEIVNCLVERVAESEANVCV